MLLRWPQEPEVLSCPLTVQKLSLNVLTLLSSKASEPQEGRGRDNHEEQGLFYKSLYLSRLLSMLWEWTDDSFCLYSCRSQLSTLMLCIVTTQEGSESSQAEISTSPLLWTLFPTIGLEKGWQIVFSEATWPPKSAHWSWLVSQGALTQLRQTVPARHYQ